MGRPRKHVTSAAVLGGVVVLLLAWTLWAVAGDSALNDPSATGVTVQAADTPSGPDTPLPVAPPAEVEEDTVDEPEALAVQPAVTGPEVLIGKVVDAFTGEPITIFQVDALEASDEDVWERLADSTSTPYKRRLGVFQMDTGPGTFDVVVQAPGYEPTVRFGLAIPAADARPFEFPMDRGPGITGLVADQHGLGVVGIKAFLHVVRLADPDAAQPRIRVVETGADGRFTFSPLSPGEYAVSLLEIDNPIDQLPSIHVEQGTTTVEMYLAPRHQLSVQTQDEQGQPVEEVLVVLQGETHFSRGHTNRNGLVVFDHVPDGPFTVTATRAGYADHEEGIELLGGAGSEVRWVTLTAVQDG